MKSWILCASLLLCPVSLYAAEAETPPIPMEEPNLYDHYVSLKRMQERLAGLPLEEQAKRQPQIQRAQQKACERLQKDHQDRVPKENYRRQGGDEFLVFSLELEQWCGTLRQ